MSCKRILNFYNRTEEHILVIIFVIMLTVTFIQVIMRFVFNNSLSWADEFARFLFVWLSWLGISIGARKGEHIKITMLVDKMPFYVAHLINILSDIIVIIICFVTIYYSVFLTHAMVGTRYISLHISYAWGYAAIPISCALMILRLLLSITASVKTLKKGAPLNGIQKEGRV